MKPPSTQNLKALGLWVFFLIYCSTFSFLHNVWLKLTLGYLIISPSSESPFHIGTLPLEWKQINPYLYRRSHTYTRHACLKHPSGRLSIQGQTEPICLVTKTNHRLLYHFLEIFEGENTGEISNKNENRAKHIREWHHLQPKTLRHYVCGSSLYILLNFLISTQCGT